MLETVVYKVIVFVFGYLLGGIVTGRIYAWFKHVDLSQMGSGNPGATNTLRTLGKKAGLITLIGDIAKLGVAVLVVWLVFNFGFGYGATDAGKAYLKLLEFYAAFGAIIGHNFPCYFKFKGGKGVACTGAVVLFVWQVNFPVAILSFLIVVLITRYVSLGSIIGMAMLFIETAIFAFAPMIEGKSVYQAIYPGFQGEGSVMLIEIVIMMFIISALGIIRHKDNIKRLAAGNENKFSFKNAGKQK